MKSTISYLIRGGTFVCFRIAHSFPKIQRDNYTTLIYQGLCGVKIVNDHIGKLWFFFNDIFEGFGGMVLHILSDMTIFV